MTRLHCYYQFSLRRTLQRPVILLSIFAACLFQSKIHAQQKSLSFFEADHPYIQYTGRIDFTNPKLPRFWHPDLAEHKPIAGELMSFIKRAMKW